MTDTSLVEEILEIASELDRGDIAFNEAQIKAETLVKKDRAEQLILSGVLASAEFKEIINQAIKDGVSRDWHYDGKNEYPVNTFDDNVATKSVIEALNKHLL